MKELALGYLWRPNLYFALDTLSNSSPECLVRKALPPKAELFPREWPKTPWHTLHVDHAGRVDRRYFLIIVDAHSKWVDIYSTSCTT